MSDDPSDDKAIRTTHQSAPGGVPPVRDGGQGGQGGGGTTDGDGASDASSGDGQPADASDVTRE